MPTNSKPTSSRSNRHTQAVVIIHGIGEQRPMETLRAFAEAILPPPEPGEEKYFSKPDALSESFELRKLQDRSQPRTHFFEYYWAYKVEGTLLGDIWSWLTTLLLRSPKKVPKQMRPIWDISWLLIIVAVVAAAFGVFDRVTNPASTNPSFLISTISALLLTALQSVVINYVGDAARYLSATTRNIKLRNEIRADGIKLLRKIQEEGKYERVIFVAHSLGSVIAYDVLKHVWQELNEDYRNPSVSGQPALARVEMIGEELREDTNKFTMKDYMDAQVAAWKELRGLGLPWLVTDLITVGSPLAHAAMLLAMDEDDLRARQRQRELPTNPPVYEIETKGRGKDKVSRRVYSYAVWDKYGPKQDITLRAIHHAGLFACTRWTNIYYPAFGDLFGDIVGGPLRHLFGKGIRDIGVQSGKPVRDHTLPAHTSYWSKDQPRETPKASELPYALPTIIEVMDLKNKSYFE
jgi:hypothetical protein